MATNNLNEQRDKAWAEYNSHRRRGDVNCEAAFKAGFDSGIVAKIMSGPSERTHSDIARENAAP